MQQEVAKSFLKSFQLTSAELSALREANITEDFFSALERVQTIHSNCRTLMQSGYQTSALDIMDQMAMYQVLILFILEFVFLAPKELTLCGHAFTEREFYKKQ